MYTNFTNKFPSSEEYIPLMSAPPNIFYPPFQAFPSPQLAFPNRTDNIPWPQMLEINPPLINNPQNINNNNPPNINNPQNIAYMRVIPQYDEREVLL